MKPFVQPIDLPASEAFSALQHMPYSLWLDSADLAHPGGRYSFVMARPAETIEMRDGKTIVTNAGQQTTLRGDVFEILKERMAAWNENAETIPGLPPFQGGLAGLFGYDLARAIENLPATLRAQAHMPDLAVGIYDQVLAFDHHQKKAWIITHAPTEREAKLKRAHILSIIKNSHYALPENSPVRWSPLDTMSEYKEKITRVIDYIHAGDIFQANLSQRFEAILPANFDSFSHYMTLREVNPAPYAAYMNLGGIVISSASPEQFLKVSDGHVTTRPIKGTRASSADEIENLENKKSLLSSRKDRAENIMIVDLLRNDLSKVCEPSSVKLKDLCRLETFAGLHHLVSTIQGQLRKTPIDLMRACFPGGSITGAPKIRSMEIIEELEPARRGPYCGSIAYIGFDGTMDSSILIRTLVYQGNKVSMNAGGGITVDSHADEEYRETMLKAEKIFRSFDESKVKKRA